MNTKSVAVQKKERVKQVKSAMTREALLAAAASVVGEHGYLGASVARITEAAGLATGTFYLHFSSRQALFDELMPDIGKRMIEFIGERIKGTRHIFDVEEKGLRAFFEFLSANPGIYRILNEAEFEAPKAYAKHFKILTRHYRDSIRRAIRDSQIRTFDDSEVDTIVYLLMAARTSLYMRYAKSSKTAKVLPEPVIATYMKFLKGGLR